MDLYRAIILDHYKHPRHFGCMEHPDKTAQAFNATCGDSIRMDVSIHDGTVIDIKFSGVGCAISQASASILTEKVLHMHVEEVMRITAADIIASIGDSLTPSRVKCATLPLEVLQKALIQ